jgi:hypothetical protein
MCIKLNQLSSNTVPSGNEMAGTGDAAEDAGAEIIVVTGGCCTTFPRSNTVSFILTVCDKSLLIVVTVLIDPVDSGIAILCTILEANWYLDGCPARNLASAPTLLTLSRREVPSFE